MTDRPDPTAPHPPPFAVAYLAPAFPVRSETFVYREVRELRRRGWDVRAIGLREPAEPPTAELADLGGGSSAVYAGGGRWVASAAAEVATHPIRSAVTLATAAIDAASPGEPTRICASARRCSPRASPDSPPRGRCGARPRRRPSGTSTRTSPTRPPPSPCTRRGSSGCRSASPATRTICSTAGRCSAASSAGRRSSRASAAGTATSTATCSAAVRRGTPTSSR